MLFKRLLFVATTAAVAWISPAAAQACSCRSVAYEEDYGWSDYVFLGNVVSTTDYFDPEDEPETNTFVDYSTGEQFVESNATHQYVEFEILESWKGLPIDLETITFFQSKQSSSCGLSFEDGYTGIVFANRLEPYPPDEDFDGRDYCSIGTSLCSARISEPTDEEIEMLDRLSQEIESDSISEPVGDNVAECTGPEVPVDRKSCSIVPSHTRPFAPSFLALLFALGYRYCRRRERLTHLSQS